MTESTQEEKASLPNVFIVDNDSGSRDSLKWLVETVGLRAVTFSSAGDFLTHHDKNAPGCVIVDLRMPGMSGIDMVEAMRAEGNVLPVIFISAYANVPTAVHAIKIGAVDFLEKPYDDQILLDRVRDCLSRDAENRRQFAALEELRASANTLSNRERQVLKLLVSGDSNKEVARTLEISPKTVEKHRANIMNKMAAKNYQDLIRKADLIEWPMGEIPHNSGETSH
ncbi:MAG: response regulator transcription factor [Woeseiaceae bacterium]|nr:response regulator transcription factor [Woeseiaceae bacterium]